MTANITATITATATALSSGASIIMNGTIVDLSMEEDSSDPLAVDTFDHNRLAFILCDLGCKLPNPTAEGCSLEMIVSYEFLACLWRERRVRVIPLLGLSKEDLPRNLVTNALCANLALNPWLEGLTFNLSLLVCTGMLNNLCHFLKVTKSLRIVKFLNWNTKPLFHDTIEEAIRNNSRSYTVERIHQDPGRPNGPSVEETLG